MLKKHFLYLIVCIIFSGCSAVPWASAAALAEPRAYSPLIITEVLPGTEQSASQEFIELYNQSDAAIDFGKQQWRLEVASSQATDWSKAREIPLDGIAYPGTYYLLTSKYTVAGETEVYLADHALGNFAPMLTATAGHVRLTHATTVQSEWQVHDAMEWTSGSSAVLEKWKPLPLDKRLVTGNSIKRRVDDKGAFNTSVETQNFVQSYCPSPTMTSRADQAVVTTAATLLPLATSVDIQDQACTPLEEEPIEEPAVIQPRAEPAALLLPAVQPAAKVQSSVKQATIPAANAGLASPHITEILPNPAKPQTDAADEFIELYNGNDASFDLSGYKLVAGLAENRSYTFPQGTSIAARQFVAFSVQTTRLSLANTAGKVSLRDPLGRTMVTTEYGATKEGQSWALAQSTWQWTVRVTPGAANVIQALTQSSTTAKKGVTGKADPAQKSTQAAASQPASPVNTTASLIPDSPLHPTVLAGVGALALLYGAYEYRRDVANKFHQFRRNRAARRANRSSVEGR